MSETIRRHRTTHVIALLAVVVVFGLLTWRRFDTPPQLPVTVLATDGSLVSVGHVLHRGDVIETGTGERILIAIGNARVALDERSRITLTRVFPDERVLAFDRGRILLTNASDLPVFVETRTTQSAVTQGRATFINFDFLHTVHLIPLEGVLQMTRTGSNEYLVLPQPIAVDEQSGSLQRMEFDEQNNAAASFYTWSAQQP